MSVPRALGWAAYRLGLSLALPLSIPLLARRRGLRHYGTTLRGRLALGDDPPVGPGPRLWIHAVSVGEVGVAATLIGALPEELPLVVTTVTPTGQAEALRRFGGEHRIEVAYLPFDLAGPVRRFLERYRPAALVLVEGDYWPLTLAEAQRRGIPVAVVNGRMSDRAFQRQRRIGPVNRLFYGPVQRFGVQSDEDRRRLVDLGVPADRVEVTGNLKFDSAEPTPKPELEALVRALAAGRPVVVAGSTMVGEEEQVLEAFQKLGGGAKALLILAPRHPGRFEGVAGLLAGRGVRWRRRSGAGEEGEGALDVLLLDTLGELASLYRLASAAFVGGTLVPTGGHNPLEPARFAVPTVVGPSMHNFRGMAARFTERGAWRQVADADELATVVGEWLDDPGAAREIGARGAALVADERGASGRTARMLTPILEATRAALRGSGPTQTG
ncbi:MAG: 3-deoxy-D-manno-octulosonic acid transferase [Acidobacteriota bacterium]